MPTTPAISCILFPNSASNITYLISLVPTLRVGTHVPTLCVARPLVLLAPPLTASSLAPTRHAITSFSSPRQTPVNDFRGFTQNSIYANPPT